jgi:hypothetical protein
MIATARRHAETMRSRSSMRPARPKRSMIFARTDFGERPTLRSQADRPHGGARLTRRVRPNTNGSMRRCMLAWMFLSMACHPQRPVTHDVEPRPSPHELASRASPQDMGSPPSEHADAGSAPASTDVRRSHRGIIPLCTSGRGKPIACDDNDAVCEKVRSTLEQIRDPSHVCGWCGTHSRERQRPELALQQGGPQDNPYLVRALTDIDFAVADAAAGALAAPGHGRVLDDWCKSPKDPYGTLICHLWAKGAPSSASDLVNKYFSGEDGLAIQVILRYLYMRGEAAPARTWCRSSRAGPYADEACQFVDAADSR